jgi:hypothetical protein
MKKIILFNILILITITLFNFFLRVFLYSKLDVVYTNLLLGYQNYNINNFWESSLGVTLILLFNSYIITFLFYLTFIAFEYKNIFSIVYFKVFFFVKLLL